MTLSNLIITYREEHGLSQRQMGAKCGLSTGYISLIEKEINPQTGKPMVPTLAVLNKIAQGMNMSIDNLISLCDDMPVALGFPAKVNPPDLENKDGWAKEFMYLFQQLTDGERALIIAQIKGILAERRKESES